MLQDVDCQSLRQNFFAKLSAVPQDMDCGPVARDITFGFMGGESSMAEMVEVTITSNGAQSLLELSESFQAMGVANALHHKAKGLPVAITLTPSDFGITYTLLVAEDDADDIHTGVSSELCPMFGRSVTPDIAIKAIKDDGADLILTGHGALLRVYDKYVEASLTLAFNCKLLAQIALGPEGEQECISRKARPSR